ncbi:MAG: YceI family protein [Actinomycetota bacterium]|nr:YceI family protein [Actinomycetota bacterium]
MTTTTPIRTSIPTGTWSVDPAHSKVGFAVKHMGVATVRGEFNEFEGTLEIGDDPAEVRAYGTVKAASVDTNQAQRDEHLRSPDFFNSEQHPEISFESKQLEPVGEDSYRIVGDLSLNGVTREIELEAELGGTEIGPQGEERIGLEVTGQLSRRDYEVKFDAALGSGNAVVADKVNLVLDIAAVKQS